MNHLAHVLLAGPDADLQLGGLLGDFVRGRPDGSWPAGVRTGVLLHRKLDVYTDSHPDVAGARALFAPPLRRYAGILVDMYLDFALARDWARHGDEPLAALSRRTRALLAANAHWLPPPLNRFAAYFDACGLFAAYARRRTIEQALGGIAARLRHRNPLAGAGPELWRLAPQLDTALEPFFSDAKAYAVELRGTMARMTLPGQTA